MNSGTSDQPSKNSVRKLIPEQPGTVSLSPITGGTNNRVFRVNTDYEPYLLKQYFSHPDDDRDRLHTEWTFSQFLRNHGVDQIAAPIANNPEQNLALYEYIEGDPPSLNDMDQADVFRAADFFRAINQHRDTDDAQDLPDASAACFSIADHLSSVNERIDQLTDIARESDVHRDAKHYVEETMLPLWESIKNDVIKQVDSGEYLLESSLDQSERYLSPSDFGFHNVIVNAEGDFYFHDFEYAGWDDPAKAAVDCFGQPEYPLPDQYLEDFIKTMIPEDGHWESVYERARILSPVHKLKWSCILLNDFLPVSGERREFARDAETDQTKLKKQLSKTKQRIETIKDEESF